MACSSNVLTVATLQQRGCEFGEKEKLHASAPVFRQLGIPTDSLTLVNPVENGDCGAQMMKMIMLAMGHASPNPRRRIFELVRQRGLLHHSRLSEYERSLTPSFGIRFLELWEILLLCEDIHVSPLIVAMRQDLGRNRSYQYSKLSYRFPGVPDGGASWPVIIIAMTYAGKHYEAVAKKMHGRGEQTALCFTFAPGEVTMQGAGFMQGGMLTPEGEVQLQAQDMRLYVDYAPPRGSLLDGSKDEVVMNPDTLHIVTDYHEDQFIVALSKKGKEDLSARLRAAGRLTKGTAAGQAGSSKAGQAGKRKSDSAASSSHSAGKKPRPHSPRPPSPRFDDDDPELAAAIAASLQAAGAPRPSSRQSARAPSRQDSMSEEERRQLEMAMMMSMQDPSTFRGMLFRSRRSLGRVRAR